MAAPASFCRLFKICYNPRQVSWKQTNTDATHGILSIPPPSTLLPILLRTREVLGSDFVPKASLPQLFSWYLVPSSCSFYSTPYNICSWHNVVTQSKITLWDFRFSRRRLWSQSPLWWRQYAPLKRRSTSTWLHGITSQKTLNFKITLLICDRKLLLSTFSWN
jgi:hypothetical protein